MERLAHSVYRVEVPLPIPSLRSVNIYVLAGGEPWLVDAGIYTAEAARQLLRGLREAGVGPCDLAGVVVTHFHVDHMTLAPLLAELGSPSFYMGRGDLALVEAGVDEFIDRVLELYTWSGMPREEAERIRQYHPVVRMLEAYRHAAELDWRPLGEGDLLRAGGLELRVAEAPGHTPGHILLQGDGLLFTGDTVLPGITPHVVLHSPEEDPLGSYLATLERVEAMAPALGLPGHRGVVGDPAARAREIRMHHEQRLRELYELLRRRGPLTGYDAARLMRWRTRYSSWDEYPPAERFFAVGEALAHLRHLEAQGQAERVERGGVLAWRAL
ncbi:MBL fold metallo-hydrolase [Pyrodictium abyssi]|uniref:MBL fold metallo-hydrolase n=1 Tax=Pyrodictium abyssi TaxID=54256 RepID=A0ABN6ZW56_9CREN|nr:MBL fold metallo-hydrolase [Pyrodictium abyssi]